MSDVEVSDPPELTPEVLRQIDEESEAWGKAFRAATEAMEWLTGDDLRTVVR